MNPLGMATRSALVRHAERTLGVRHRPREARDIVSAINPIPQPTPHVSSEGESERKANDLAAVAIMAIIFGAFVLAQYLQQGGAQ